MKTSSNYSCKGIPIQATPICLLLHIKDELTTVLQKPGIVHQRSPEKLTKEAVFMICVILAFVLLSISGTLVTIYEFFFSDNNAKYVKSKYMKNGASKSIAKRNEKEMKSSEKAGFESFKSFLRCFCFLKNGRKILNSSSGEGQIESIQGLRFVTSICIIHLHAGLGFLSILKDMEPMRSLIEMRVSQIFLSGMTVVNVFFVISAYLNAKSFFSKYSRSNGNISWFDFYFKRFMRLTPVYMIVLGFYATLLSYTGSGIIWPKFDTNPVCKINWFYNLLYINNIGDASKECMSWCWYLAADMQLYIISPLYMILLLRRPRIGYALSIASICGAAVTSFILTYKYNLVDGFARLEFYIADLQNIQKRFWESFDVEYTKTYTRIGAYLVGILLAYFLHEKQINKDTANDSLVSLCCGWIVAAVMLWLSIFSLHKREEILTETALFNSTKNLFFSCGVAWIMYLCITKQAGFLDKCLSWKYFLPLSRLSYCAYLIHPLVLERQLLLSEDLMDYSIISAVFFNVHITFFAYAISFVLSVLFEIPVQNLLDWFGHQKRKDNSRNSHHD